MIGVRKYHPTSFEISAVMQKWKVYLGRDSFQKVDGMDKSPDLSSCSLIIKNSSALFGNLLTICCETVPCTEVMTPPFWYTVPMTDYAQLLFSPGVLHNTV